MKAVATALTFTAICIALASCGNSASGPDLSDDALAKEYTQKVFGKSLEDAAAGPAAAKQAVLDSAAQNCETLRTYRDRGRLSTDTPTDPRNATAIGALEVENAKAAALTAQQTQDALVISARYRCDEFSPMLRVYDATH